MKTLKPHFFSKTILATIILTTLIISIAYAAILYTLTIPNTMKLHVSYGLELHENDGGLVGALITEIVWDAFNKGETKNMMLFLVNTGDVAENVVWTANVPSEWAFNVNHDLGVWSEGTPLTIGASDAQYLHIELTELSATLGVTYAFDWTFDVVD